MLQFYRSTIGKKFVVALTGLILFGFVFLHMAGNLKIFMGAEAGSNVHKLDLYAQFLRQVGHEMVGAYTVLWLTRIVLLVALVLHLITILQLQALRRASRPIAYASYQYQASSYAARSMFYGGILLFLFIIFHLLHMTTGDLNFAGFVPGQVYGNVLRSFAAGNIILIYLISMGVLGMHLYHGLWSMFQTCGLDSPQRNVCLRKFAFIFSLLIAVGFCAVPLAVYAGLLPAPENFAVLQTH